MASNSYSIPETWLASIGGYDASGWLSAFAESPKQAVADLLEDAFYFGPLNVTERAQLLEGWLDVLGNSESFADRLDAQFTNWIEENWGQYNRPAASLVSVWSCLCSVIEFSSKLPMESQLKESAMALRLRLPESRKYLGSFSTAPTADPLGLYLAVIAEFQRDDRSLATFWHHMCDLPDGIPFYHAPYAMLGLRRLGAANSTEDGTLRAEVVLGLLRLARAFQRLVRTRGLAGHIAKSTFQRLARETASAYPNSPGWVNHGLNETLELPDPAQKWVLETVAPLAKAVRAQREEKVHPVRGYHKTAQPNPDWPARIRKLVPQLKSGDPRSLTDARQLLNEQSRYTEATGDTYYIGRTLCNFAMQVRRRSPQLALHWAEEARKLDLDHGYAWSIVITLLARQGRLSEALRFAWVAWKRFPEDRVISRILAEVLKEARRYEEAEAIYREVIERFPDDAVTRGGLAEVLKATRRYQDAEAIYRETIQRFPEDIRSRNALADTLRRMGLKKEAEAEYRRSIKSGYVDPATFVGLAYLILSQGDVDRVEATELIERALELDPQNHYALALKRELTPQGGLNLDDFIKGWDKAAGSVVERLTVPTIEKVESVDYPEVKEEGKLEQAESFKAQPFITANPLAVAALVAEAYFYRTWAKDADSGLAEERRRIAAELLHQAEQLSPYDPGALTEKIALSIDQGHKAAAYENLVIQLGTHPATTSLLVLKARMDRERAREENRRMNESTLSELCISPQRLRDLDPTLIPLFHYQKGLAALALLDGEERKRVAADAFSRFRRTLAQRSDAEHTEREAAYNQQRKSVPHFYDWIQEQVNRRIFAGVGESGDLDIRGDHITQLEAILEERRPVIEGIEDIFVDRLTFSII